MTKQKQKMENKKTKAKDLKINQEEGGKTVGKAKPEIVPGGRASKWVIGVDQLSGQF